MFHNFCVFSKGGAQLLRVNAWLSSFTGRLSSRVSLSMGLLLISLYRLILEDLSAQNVRAWRVFFFTLFPSYASQTVSHVLTFRVWSESGEVFDPWQADVFGLVIDYVRTFSFSLPIQAKHCASFPLLVVE